MQTAIDEYSKLLEARDVYTRALEEKVVDGTYKKSQETGVKITLPEAWAEMYEKFGAKTIEELFVCSDSEVSLSGEEIKVEIKKAKGEKCPRCWNYRELDDHGVCTRCAKVLKDLNFDFNA